MQTLHLKEYRCTCGKLLFKGIVLLSLVEIKCKRCAKISSFGELIETKAPVSFLISIDHEGIIKDMCRGAEIMLGYSRDQLIGSSIMQVCPLIHDKVAIQEAPSDGKVSKRTYKIDNTAFLVKDGRKFDAESYCITPKKSTDFSGYHIFSRLK